MSSKLILSLFVARYLGFEILGIYGMIAGAAALVPVLLRFGIMNSICRDAVSDAPGALAVNMRHYLKAMAALYAVLIMAAVIFGFYVENPAIPLLIIGVFAAEHVAQDLFNLANNLQMPRRANIIIFASSGLWSLSYMAFAYFHEPARTLEAILAFWLASAIPALLVAWQFLAPLPWHSATQKSQPFFHWLFEKIHQSKFLFAGEFANHASFYLDRYLIALLLDLETTGIYILFWQVGSAVYNLVNAGSMQIFSPLLIAAHDQKNTGKFEKTFRSCLVWTTSEAVVISLAAAIAFPLLLRIANNPATDAYMGLLYVVLLGQLVRIGSDLIGFRLHTRRKDKLMSASYVLLFLLTALFASLGVTLAGVYGAAIATTATYLSISLFRWHAAGRTQ